MKNKDRFWSLLGDYFKVYPIQRNLSENTVNGWRHTWNIFLSWLINDKGYTLKEITMESVSSKLVIEFLDEMTASRYWSPQTRNERLSMIRSFYQYAASIEPLYYHKYQELLNIRKAKCVDKSGVIDYIPKQGITTLLSVPDPSTRLGCRDQFYMSLAYDIAARTCEMTSLKLKDFNKDKKTVILKGKGKKQRIVPVSDQTIALYKRYVKIFHTNYDPDNLIFYTVHDNRKTKMSSDTVARFLNHYAGIARLQCSDIPDRVHPHQAFRASRAMHMLQDDAPLATVALILGHSDPITTVKHYAAADTEMKRKLMERAIKEMLPSHFDDEAVWQNNKDIIGKLIIGK